jgi:hypothetical protein
LLYIQHKVDSHHFEKISKPTKSKEACDILEKYHDGGKMVKQVKLESSKKKYELVQMEEDQKIGDYFSKFIF